MNIRNRCTKVCLFLWVLGMCFAAHPLHAQSVIPVPLKIEQGTGSFLLSEKTKLYTNIQGGEARLLESYLQALPVHLKKGKKKDTQNVLSLLITEKSEQLPSPESYTLSVTLERILIRAGYSSEATLVKFLPSSDTSTENPLASNTQSPFSTQVEIATLEISVGC